MLEIQAGCIFDANNREHTTLTVQNGFTIVGLTEMTAVFDSGWPTLGTARLEVNEGILTNQGTIQATTSRNCSNCGGRVIIAQLVNHGDGVVIVDYLAASVPLAPPIEGWAFLGPWLDAWGCNRVAILGEKNTSRRSINMLTISGYGQKCFNECKLNLPE